MKRFLFISSLLLLMSIVSCKKEDSSEKLSSNPIPYREDDAAGIFTVKIVFNASAYYEHGQMVIDYLVGGSIPGSPLPENTEFVAGDLHVPADLNKFKYQLIYDHDSTLKPVFGHEALYTLRNSSDTIFSTVFEAPPLLMVSCPVDSYLAPPIEVSKSTVIGWVPLPSNTYMVVEVERHAPYNDRQYIQVANDGKLTLSSIWSSLPAKSAFRIGLYQGTHTTIVGSDSKKYIINGVSMAYSHVYTKKGI